MNVLCTHGLWKHDRAQENLQSTLHQVMISGHTCTQTLLLCVQMQIQLCSSQLSLWLAQLHFKTSTNTHTTWIMTNMSSIQSLVAKVLYKHPIPKCVLLTTSSIQANTNNFSAYTRNTIQWILVNPPLFYPPNPLIRHQFRAWIITKTVYWFG